MLRSCFVSSRQAREFKALAFGYGKRWNWAPLCGSDLGLDVVLARIRSHNRRRLGQGAVFAPWSVFCGSFDSDHTSTSIGRTTLLGLRVVDFETGGMIPPLRIAIRTLLICLVLPAIFKKDGRNLHDVFANSRVVKI